MLMKPWLSQLKRHYIPTFALGRSSFRDRVLSDPLSSRKSYMGCPFCVAAHEENDGRVYQVSRLKD